jgi:type III pantothenate kinase
MGTATTFCAISKNKEFLGGAIIPGVKISMGALVSNTAKLPTVELVKMESALGRSTVEGIQAGLYFSTMGAVREISRHLMDEAFPKANARLVGTGGFTSLFQSENLFDVEVPDLILQGLYLAHLMNHESKKAKSKRKGVNHADPHVEI